jgi:hypothetical protein
MPIFILDALNKKHLQSWMSVFTGKDERSSTPSVSLASLSQWQSVLTHSAASTLTSFIFQPVAEHQLYDDFKKDLVTMLTRSRVLRTLNIQPDFLSEQTYPEMLNVFRACDLPRLQDLTTHGNNVQIFTKRELAIWGAKDGWNNLTTLGLCHADHLISFLGRTPKLEKLMLIPRDHNDYDRLDDYIETANIISPFPNVRYLYYQAPVTYYGVQETRSIPWCILHHLSELTSLDLYRSRFDTVPPGPALDVPTATDIAALRARLPELIHLAIDVDLQGPYAEWPHIILAELASFRKVQSLFLFLHREHKRRTAIMNNPMDYLYVGCRIRKERKRLGKPQCVPFEVKFKVVVPWLNIKEHYNLPDCWVLSKEGPFGPYSTSYWQKFVETEQMLDKMTMEELKKKKGRQFAGKLGWDRKGYGKEIERRGRNKSTTASANGCPTLYDAWTT